jgi:phosphoribosylformylglycinamidine (FGAM) synthase PurS component
MTIRAYVHRKTSDLVRYAAEDGLRAGWTTITGVDRSEVWSFDVAGQDAAAAETVRGILEDTALVVNPNVHRYTLEPPASGGGEAVRVTLLVRDLVDARGAAVLRTLRERRGMTSLTAVRRAVQWTIDVAADAKTAGEIAELVTGGGARGAGLLANRHSQEVRIQVEGK